MLTRSSCITHPSGSVIETPLLVPSFSSKGFERSTGDGEPEIAKMLRVATGSLTDSVLVSAFDMHHGFLPRPAMSWASITLVDSGGYEVSAQASIDESVATDETLPWDLARYQGELDRWPAHVPAVFVTFDADCLGTALSEQIEVGSEFVNRYEKHLTVLLVRPESGRQRFVNIDRLIDNVGQLAAFAMVGITEKELGDSQLDRMVNLARIRLALDEAGLPTAIHVFGCLDPISVPLLFMSGAEVFDGLAWLRYGFQNGVAMYRQNYAALNIGVERSDDFVRVKTLRDNLGSLVELRQKLKRFHVEREFRVFEPQETIMLNSFNQLVDREPRAR